MKNILAIGVFDLFHVGHLRFLQYAKAQGTHLSVAVCPDQIVHRVKKRTPVINEQQRLEIIQGLSCVDVAALQPESTENAEASALWIASWNIHTVVAGGCWQGSERWQRLTAALAHKNISVEFAPHTEFISTTEIIQSIQARNQMQV
jgi:glycerol-3-phosphate cytidylyltransferase